MGKCRRILFEIGNMEIAGAQKMVLDLAIYYVEHGYTVMILVLCNDPNNHFSEMLKKKAIEVCYVPYRYNFTKRVKDRFMAIECAVRKFKPDVIHGHLDYKYLWIYAILHRRRVIMTFHSQPYRLDTRLFRLLYSLLSRKNLITPVWLTKGNRDEFIERYGGRKNEGKIIPNPIVLSEFHSRKGEDKGIVTFCFVARFHPIKNHEMLIRAFHIVHEKLEGCELILAGDGENRGKIEKLVCQLGLENNVIFLGEVKDIPELLKKVDIGVISSDSESFSLFLLECMAMGIPTVATRTGGMEELMDGNGMLVKCNDAEDMASAMLELAWNDDLRASMSKTGLKLAKQYDISQIASRYLDLYEEDIK